MWYKYHSGGIFILKRNIIITGVFFVAWIFAITGAVCIKNSNVVVIEKSYELAENDQEKEITSIENLDGEVEESSNNETENENKSPDKVLSGVTSRSGINAKRESRTVYYEEINLNLTEEEIEIFERIVEAEVGGTNYEGKLAVANVILNRVQSSRFPNTLKEVVFANRQFSPISDGRYYTVKVSETTKQVVQDALNGSRIIGEDAYYFCTPTAPGKGWFETDLRKIEYIEPHNFYGYKE